MLGSPQHSLECFTPFAPSQTSTSPVHAKTPSKDVEPHLDGGESDTHSINRYNRAQQQLAQKWGHDDRSEGGDGGHHHRQGDLRVIVAWRRQIEK